MQNKKDVTNHIISRLHQTALCGCKNFASRHAKYSRKKKRSWYFFLSSVEKVFVFRTFLVRNQELEDVNVDWNRRFETKQRTD